MLAALLRHAKSVAVASLVLAVGSPAAAQHFGRNKLRYRSFDFQVLKTEHFDIYFYSRERDGVDIAARLAERWYARLERLFSYTLSNRQPVILYASHADFEQTNIIPDELSEATGGVTEPTRRRIVMPLAGSIADTDHVVGHELVHAFQFDLTSAPGPQRHATGLDRLPLWFVEGMAEYISLGSVDANTAMRLRDAAARDLLPSIADLSSPKFFPYQWGHAVFAYIAGRYGDAVIPHLLMVAAATGSVEAAIVDVLDVSSHTLSNEWHASIRSLYAPVLAAATPLIPTGRPLLETDSLGADLNIGPALSPDGRWIAFLSSRGLFSTDLYIADTESGRVVRKLTRTASDPHLSSIQFIHSAGTWDGASRRIALATVAVGRAALAIFDARTGKREREIVVDGVDEILNPSWAPDGHAIAFTAMRQGLTDLYIYDLRGAKLRQITNDAYADLHPAWSPDSRRIAFVSDRFTSDLESLHMGPLQLAIADGDTGVIERVPAFAAARHINPHWSPDGQSLYFISDPDGIPNVYRLALAHGTTERITAVATGVSGITPSSPALSVSSGSGRLAMGVFEDEQYNIYIYDAADPPDPVAGGTPGNAAALPPGDQNGGLLAGLLAQPDQGLPVPQAYPTSPYKARLSLAGLGQTTAGVGVSRFGAGAGGGAAVMFSDMLGDHLLATAVQINSGMLSTFSLSDLAFEAAYFNRAHRWNWGVLGGQIPYVASTIESAIGTSAAGERLAIDRQITYRETQRGATCVLTYPFDRARRVEFQGGFAQTSFERIVSLTAYSMATGNVVSDTTSTLEAAQRLNLATTAVALVFDTASFGPTSPIQGQRYRFEVTPTFGSINFTGVLVDYRRYVMPVSFYTIAARVIHYGRYGPDADDGRLYPIYLNDPGFVRGYDSRRYSTRCTPTPAGDCDRYTGSRMLLGNVELRFPMLRPFQVSRAMYGPLPIELAVFADSGVAWNGREKPAIVGGSRRGITSAGLAVRMRLGFAVAEFDVTRPFQRSDQGMVFGFNLSPGW